MSNLTEDFETLEPAEEVQVAYDNAAKSNWTISRQSVAMFMGCSILNGVYGPELKGLQTKGVYPNVLHDVVIVLWLVSLSPEQVLDLLSYPNKKQGIADAYAWAEKNGIRYGSPKYLDGVRTLSEIVGGIFTSFYAREDSAKEPPRKNGTRRLGKSGRHTTQSSPAEKALTT